MTLSFADPCPFNLRTPALARRVRYTTSPSAQTTRVCAWGHGVSASLLSHLRTRCVASARSRGFLMSSAAHIRRACAHRPQLALPPCPPVLGLMYGSVAVVETVKEIYTDAVSVVVRLRVHLTAVGCFVGGVIELVISIQNGELMRVTNRRCS
jgi:hypothetical protein